MIVFNSLLKQGLLSIDESTLAFENGKLTAKISMGGYTEVETLPSIADAKEGVTYLVPTGDYFTMYVVDKTNGKWITLGTTSSKTYEFGDGLVESGGVVTLDDKPKAIRDYFVSVDQWGAAIPSLAIQDTLDVAGDITTESALKGETLEIGDTIGADATGLYDTRTTYPDDGKYVVTKYLLEERIKNLTLSVPTNLSQLNNDVGFATQSWTTSQITSSRNQCVLKSGSTMTGALTINNDIKALPLGFTTSMGVPAYGLQVSSTYGLQLFGTHFLNGTLWGDDGLKIVNNNLSLTTLDEAFISSDYANTTTFRAMPNDGVQATYQFQGWGWDDDSHTTKSPRLGVRLLKPNQATTLESTSVLNMSEGDNRWVSLSGGTMTGYLNVPSPTASTHPTTKSYVDNLVASSGGGLQNKATGVYSLSILGNSTTSNYSVTIGVNANANASGSTALGYYAYTSGSFSIALGYCTVASGTSSTALGHGTTASGYYSSALGFKATSSEKGVTAISAWNDSGNAKTQFKIIGKGSTASTNKLGGKSGIEYEEYNTSGTITNSGAISFEALVSGGGGGSGGLENLATGTDSLSILGNATTSDGSVSVGSGTNASGSSSTALGNYTIASGSSSIGLGSGASAEGNSSIALGNEALATGSRSTAIGFRADASDIGVTAIAAWNDSGNAKTQFKIIGAGSTASTTKLGGKSGLEYEEYDARGVVTQSGAISFEDLVSGGGGGSSVSVDTALSTTSTNPVQNKVVTTAINGKQATLVSGTNIKTINGQSLLGSGNITISGGGGGGLENLATGVNSLSILGYATTSNYSVTIGGDANASHNYATAVGYFASTGGDSSTAIGNRASTHGSSSTALGDSAYAGEGYSTALGSGAKANREYSISVGYNADASGYYSTALGDSAYARGNDSIAIGTYTNANDSSSTALGYRANAIGYSSIALGDSAYARGNDSIAIGRSTRASGKFSTAIGGYTQVHDYEVASIGAFSQNNSLRTQLYVIAEGSPASAHYLGGRAGLAYAVWGDNEIFPNGKVKEGKIIAFETLFANGYDFIPTTEEISGDDCCCSSCCGCC